MHRQHRGKTKNSSPDDRNRGQWTGTFAMSSLRSCQYGALGSVSLAVCVVYVCENPYYSMIMEKLTMLIYYYLRTMVGFMILVIIVRAINQHTMTLVNLRDLRSLQISARGQKSDKKTSVRSVGPDFERLHNGYENGYIPQKVTGRQFRPRSVDQ